MAAAPSRPSARHAIRLKRVYDTPSEDDGTRVLVERLWPRGLSKQRARVDLWMKDIAPSSELRKWFAHDVAKWPEFQRRYQAELAKRSEDVRRLVDLACNEPVTLVFAARDCEHNSAVVLKQTIERKLQGRRKP